MNKSTMLFILLIHIFSLFSIGFDIPLFRQFFSFLYLTFIPGFIFIRYMKISEDDLTSSFLLSVSLSILFLMLVGLLVNFLLPLFGFSDPLSLLPLTICLFTSSLIALLLTQQKRFNKNQNILIPLFKENINGLLMVFLTILIFIFSVFGALTSHIALTVFAMILTAVVFATCTLSKNIFPSKIFSFVVFLISLSLLYQTTLLSSHIMGYDIFVENYVFQITKTMGYWSSPGITQSFSVLDNFNSVLSTTILPTIYSVILNVDEYFIFSIFYPFVFSLVPLFLYKIYQSQFGKIVGLLSTFFFIANPLTFYGLEPISLSREIIAYLFFSAAIFLLINKNIDLKIKRILLISFSVGVVISAYSLSFIYVVFIVFTHFASRYAGKKEQVLNLPLVVIIVAIVFGWYLFVANPPFNKFTFILSNILQKFTQDFASSEARLASAYDLLSPTVQTSFVGAIHKILIYMSHGFIVVGALFILLKKRVHRLNPEFRWMIICATGFLIITLIIPNLAPALNFSRFYRITMVFLSPLYVLGGLYLLHFISNRRFNLKNTFNLKSYKINHLLVIAIILSSFFLFRVGLVNYVSGEYSNSVPLTFNNFYSSTDFQQRLSVLSYYVPDSDVYSAKWLRQNMNNTLPLYADSYSTYHTLTSYALYPINSYDLYRNMTFYNDSYIFLSTINVKLELLTSTIEGSETFNITEIDFSNTNIIYSNGDAKILYSP